MTPPSVEDKENRKRKPGKECGSDSEECEEYSDEEGGMRIDDIYIPPPPQNTCSSELNGPRLIITRIVNENFKSYAGVQVLGPFHKCFNAIIGPNGSGKSNVIDSMLFVFGYRATKIRSKKISVLLHNSEHHRDVESCTVSVHFAQIINKEGDDYDIVPDSEFVISRTALKDNSSFYQIDGRRVQLKEVAQLLRKHGIDLDHNRFLILQGEVEQIAMMKCKGQNEHETGMLEYLEDIIGTSRYKVPLVKLEEKVELLAERRTEKLNRVNLVHNELEQLKGPKDDAVGYLKTENTAVSCRNYIYQKKIHDLQVNIDDKEHQRGAVEESYKELRETLAATKKEKIEKEKFLNEKIMKYQALEKRREDLKVAFNKASNKDDSLLNDMTRLNKTRKKTKELLLQEEKKLIKLEKIPEENQKTIIECRRREKELTTKMMKLTAEKGEILQSVQIETHDLQVEKEKIQRPLTELKQRIDKISLSFKKADGDLRMFVRNEEAEAAKLENLRVSLEEDNSAIKQKLQILNELKNKIFASEKTINNPRDELSAIKAELPELMSNIHESRTSLELARSSMQASHSRNKVVEVLMNQKLKGRCPGVFGRLGDLGGIDLKYDVAVSTACGRLDNIVVDTADTAQWCIEYLRKNNLRRTVFIALEKLQHLTQQANSRIQTPENVHRLYDLIRIEDDRVRNAFYFSLRNTLVANDLVQAKRIAYGAQRYRVVSLQGDLIELSGTMSGGGNRVRRGRMGQSAVAAAAPEDIKELETNLGVMQNRLQQLQQRQTDCEQQLEVLEPELFQMKSTYKRLSEELEGLRERQPVSLRKLQEQENIVERTKADPIQKKRLESLVISEQTALDEANSLVSEIQTKVDVINRQIQEKTTEKTKAIFKKIEEVASILKECTSEISKLNLRITTSQKDAEKSKENIENMKGEIIKFQEILKTMNAEREETASDAQQLLTCIEEITAQLEGDTGFDDIKEEVTVLSKQELKLKSDKIEVEEKLKNYDSAINGFKAHIHQWKSKRAQLKLHNIPEETVEPLKTYSQEELCNNQQLQQMQNELHVAEEELKVAKPDLKIIEEFKRKQDVFIQRSKELDEISTKKAQMADMYEKVKNRRKEEFKIGYDIIRAKLKEMYQMITLGGDANFEMVDTFDPFSEGIQFNVRPPKKSWKVISNLSGGEKTLSSLALVFALHYYKPSPLYVMDEIDAALDFKNVSIVGNYIKERTKNAQFIIISLRSNMFELCDNLIGIYKNRNCTKSVTINPRVYENNAEQIPNSQRPTEEAQPQNEEIENMDADV